MPKKTDDIYDFDANPPKPVTDVHMIGGDTPQQQQERMARHNAPPIVRPPQIRTSVAEQKALAADPTTPSDIRQRAIDVLKVYTTGYEAAAKEMENASPEYKNGSGILAILKSGRADFACLEFQD